MDGSGRPDIGAPQTVAKLVDAGNNFTFLRSAAFNQTGNAVMKQFFFNPAVTNGISGSSLHQRHKSLCKPISKGKTHP